MEVEDIVEGVVDMLGVSEMDIKTENNIIEATLDGKKFRITVEEVES